MTVVIALTEEQWEALTLERAKIGAMEDASAPGMMIAQVFGDHMRVGVIDNEKARAVQRAFGVENDGETCRTAYEVPANAKLCNEGGKMKRGSIDLARRLCYEIAGPTDENDDMTGIDYGGVDIAEILSAEVERLRAAICQTLDANSHLADGEVCTLLALKVALRESGEPWDGDELHNAELRGRPLADGPA